MFRVHHEGALQGTTLLTSYTVGGLLPCQQYQAKVEALCGDDLLMSAKTVTAHTGNVEIDEETTQLKTFCASMLAFSQSVTLTAVDDTLH